MSLLLQQIYFVLDARVFGKICTNTIFDHLFFQKLEGLLLLLLFIDIVLCRVERVTNNEICGSLGYRVASYLGEGLSLISNTMIFKFLSALGVHELFEVLGIRVGDFLSS